MSTESVQLRDDEGGGGRFEAISALTDMDENGSPNAIHPAPLTPIPQVEDVDMDQNNKRHRESEVNDTSKASRFKPATQSDTPGSTFSELYYNEYILGSKSVFLRHV